MSDGSGATPETGVSRVLAGRYRLLSMIGSGGMGSVWHARDELLDRDVAVKEVKVRTDLTDEERAILTERTKREARATARLSHPGIITVHDVVEEDGRPCIVMEYVAAGSLQEILERHGPLPVPEVAEIGRQMLSALRAAHAAGILHRDVKPANVLLIRDEPRAVLTDFGLAQMAGDVTLTQTGLVMGSPAYIAPERARGEKAGPPADLWALGATLYAAVEGRPPHDRSEVMAALAAVLYEDPPPPRHAGPLTPLLMALLERDADRRPTLEAAADHLAMLTGRPSSGPRAVPSAPGPRSAARLNQTAMLGEATAWGPADASAALDPTATPREVGSSAGAAFDQPGMRADGSPGTAGLLDQTAVPGDGGIPAYPGGADAAVRPDWEPRAGRGGAALDATVALGAPPEAAPGRTERWAAEAPPGRGSAGRRVLWSGTALAVAAVAAVGVVVYLNSGADKSTRGRVVGQPPASEPTKKPHTQQALPAGWAVNRESGFSIAMPRLWKRRISGASVYWLDPKSDAYAQVDQTPWTDPDPSAHWRTLLRQIPASNHLKGFTPLTPIQQVAGLNAADLEFTYTPRPGVLLHTVDRSLIAPDGRRFAILVAYPDKLRSDHSVADAILASFKAR